MDFASGKKRLRERVGALRDAMSAQEHAVASAAICERLWQLGCSLARTRAETAPTQAWSLPAASLPAEDRVERHTSDEPRRGSGRLDDLLMRAVDPATRSAADEPEYNSASLLPAGFTLAAYMPHRSEVDIVPLIERLWRAGLPAALPKAERQERLLRFFYARGLEDLAVGAYGIREPLPTLPEATDSELAALDVLLVPGLAFDESLRRLGYGGGYYDRLLARLAVGGSGKQPIAPQPASSSGMLTCASSTSPSDGGRAQKTSTPVTQPGALLGSAAAGRSGSSPIVTAGTSPAQAAPAPRRRPWLVAAAFELQLVDAVPTEPHDLPLDAIVTERRIILPL